MSVVYRFAVVIVSAVAALLLPLGTASAQDPIPDFSFTREPHPPIVIDDDTDFENPIGLSGVRGGSGVVGDPYRIDGWQIDVSFWRGVTVSNSTNLVDNKAITIRNTTQHVLIRNNQLGSAGVGIDLLNAPNVRIELNQMAGITTPISARNIPGPLTITNLNSITGGTPISVKTMTGALTITGNTISATSVSAISVEDVSGGPITINGNIIGGSPEDALVSLTTSTAATTISSNRFTCPGAGVIILPATQRRAGVGALGNPGSISIVDNRFNNCRNAILLEAASASIQQNCFDKNINGVVLKAGSSATQIHNNDFIENVGLAVINDHPGQPTIDATSNCWQPTGVPNDFVISDGEKTYPSVDETVNPALGSIKYLPEIPIISCPVAPTCG